MNLEKYIIDLCAKLRGNEEVTIDASSMHYRHLMASVLEAHLTGPASSVVEGLLGQVWQMQIARENAMRASLTETEVKVQKPKRTIQSVPKSGKMAKKKIEDAVNEVGAKAVKE